MTWKELYLGARRAGIPPDWFWMATPAELALEIEAQSAIRQQDRAQIWMSAALQRVKKLPPIEAFTGVKQKRKQTWQEMRAIVRAAATDGYHSTTHRPEGSEPRTQKTS